MSLTSRSPGFSSRSHTPSQFTSRAMMCLRSGMIERVSRDEGRRDAIVATCPAS